MTVYEWENGGDVCYGASPPVTFLSLRKLTAPDRDSPFAGWFPLLVAAAGFSLVARRMTERGSGEERRVTIVELDRGGVQPRSVGLIPQ